MQQRRIQGTQGRKGWQRFLLPLIIIAAGTALALVSTLLGGVVILVGYVWPAFQSLSGGLALYVIFAPFQIGLTVHHHHIDVSDLMAIVMGIKLLAISVRDGTESLWQRFMGSPFWRPLLLVLVLSVLSLATALSHTTTVVKILEYLEFFVVVTAVVRHADLREEQWKPAIHALFAVASVLSLYGLYQFMFQVGPHANVIDRYHIRADAVFGQPNAFGGFESMVFPLMLAFIAYGPDWGKRWWSWVGLSLSALGVIDSFSLNAGCLTQSQRLRKYGNDSALPLSPLTGSIHIGQAKNCSRHPRTRRLISDVLLGHPLVQSIIGKWSRCFGFRQWNSWIIPIHRR